MNSLKVEYIAFKHDPETGRFDPWITRVSFAGKERLRFNDFQHYTSELPIGIDIARHQNYFDGRNVQMYSPMQGRLQVFENASAQEFSFKTRLELYVESIGWWPPGDGSTPPGKRHVGELRLPFYLRDAFKSDAYVVRPAREDVAGHACYVLERPGIDTIWIDPAIGYGIRRREWYAETPHFVTTRYELTDYHKYADGIWLPRAIHRVYYQWNESTRAPSKSFDSSLVVQALEVNTLTSEFFQFQPPSGTLVETNGTGAMTQVPGGIEQLDSIIDLAQRRAAIFAAAGMIVPRQEASTWRLQAMTVLVALLMAVDVVLIAGAVRRFRRPQAQTVT